MKPRTLDVLTVFFAYGGNSGFPSEHPKIREWWSKTLKRSYADERIGRFGDITIAEPGSEIGTDSSPSQ